MSMPQTPEPCGKDHMVGWIKPRIPMLYVRTSVSTIIRVTRTSIEWSVEWIASVHPGARILEKLDMMRNGPFDLRNKPRSFYPKKKEYADTIDCEG